MNSVKLWRKNIVQFRQLCDWEGGQMAATEFVRSKMLIIPWGHQSADKCYICVDNDNVCDCVWKSGSPEQDPTEITITSLYLMPSMQTEEATSTVFSLLLLWLSQFCTFSGNDETIKEFNLWISIRGLKKDEAAKWKAIIFWCLFAKVRGIFLKLWECSFFKELVFPF